MSHFNAIRAGEAAIDRGEQGLGMLRNEVALLRRSVHELGAPTELMVSLGVLETDVANLNAEWDRITAKAQELIDE